MKENSIFPIATYFYLILNIYDILRYISTDNNFEH